MSTQVSATPPSPIWAMSSATTTQPPNHSWSSSDSTRACCAGTEGSSSARWSDWRTGCWSSAAPPPRWATSFRSSCLRGARRQWGRPLSRGLEDHSHGLQTTHCSPENSAGDTQKALLEVHVLVGLIQKSLGEEHKTQRKTHTHTLRSKESKEAVYSVRKWKLHTQEFGHPHSEGPATGFFDPPFILFLALWMGGVFLIRDGIFPGGGLRCGLDGTRLRQLPVPPIRLLRPRYVHSESCFPLNSTLLVKRHTGKVVQSHQQPVHFYCTCSVVFMARVSCSDATVSVLDAIPPCIMASLKSKTRRWHRPLPKARPCLSCLTGSPAEFSSGSSHPQLQFGASSHWYRNPLNLLFSLSVYHLFLFLYFLFLSNP